MSEIISFDVGETSMSELCDGIFIRIHVIDAGHARLDFINDYGKSMCIQKEFIIRDITNPDRIVDVISEADDSFILLLTKQYEYSYKQIWAKIINTDGWEIQGVQEWL